MSRFSSFFETPPDQQLNRKVLERAQTELQLNQSFYKRRRFFFFLSPALASLAAFIVYKISLRQGDFTESGSEQIELLTELLEDHEALELVDELALLEELEFLEDEEFEG